MAAALFCSVFFEQFSTCNSIRLYLWDISNLSKKLFVAFVIYDSEHCSALNLQIIGSPPTWPYKKSSAFGKRYLVLNLK